MHGPRWVPFCVQCVPELWPQPRATVLCEGKSLLEVERERESARAVDSYALERERERGIEFGKEGYPMKNRKKNKKRKKRRKKTQERRSGESRVQKIFKREESDKISKKTQKKRLSEKRQNDWPQSMMRL